MTTNHQSHTTFVKKESFIYVVGILSTFTVDNNFEMACDTETCYTDDIAPRNRLLECACCDLCASMSVFRSYHTGLCPTAHT